MFGGIGIISALSSWSGHPGVFGLYIILTPLLWMHPRLKATSFQPNGGLLSDVRWCTGSLSNGNIAVVSLLSNF